MKRTKSPTLTSPWKIGFLVSLMLVFVSIGVSYYFVHQYGVPLNILERDWLDRSEWLGVIRGEGFLFEVLPLVGLVAIIAIISYMTITAAVRRYKKYLDSGHDYKNILSSLKEIEDLEDKKKIERIKNHPELKRLLLGVAESLEEKERLLSEREGGLETRVADALAAREKEIQEDIARECDRLSKAVEARSLDPSAIEFANPDLARLSKAVERALQANAGPAPTDLALSYTEMRKTAETFQTKFREISEELRLSRETAQGIEQQIRSIAVANATNPEGRVGGTERAAKEVRTVLGSLRDLDDLAAAIDLTAEEARGVAINTALRAGSGEGTQDDLIRLAEDVKELAGRFRDEAKRFFQLSTAMRSSAGTLETLAADSARRGTGAAGTTQDHAAVLSRVSLWVERIVVLSDRVMNLSETYGVAMTTLPAAPRDNASRTRVAEPVAAAERGAADAREDEFEAERSEWTGKTDASEIAVPEDSKEFGFQTLDRSGSIFTDEQPAGEATDGLLEKPETADRDEYTEEHETDRVADDTASGREIEIPAERGVFEEMTARPLGSAEDDVIRQAEIVQAAPEKLPTGQRTEAPQSGADPFESSGSLLSRLGAQDRRAERDAAPAHSVTTAEPDEDVIDLYALGAVDYDPALHG